MLGFKPKRQGLFRPPNGTPGIGDGLDQYEPAAMPVETMPIEQKPSFFGQGGTGRHIAGAIGDAMAQFGGMSPVYAPAMQARQDALLAERLAAAKRLAEREDFKWKEDYKRENPSQAPTELERYMKSAGIDPASPEGQAMFKQAAENKANPPVWRQGPDGQFYRMDVPTKPVGKITPLTGGAGSNAGGGF